MIERGPGANRFEVGDRVMGIVAGGGQAELAVVHERILMPVPDNLDLGAAGARARGVHHGPRRRLHPGRAARPASACSSTAARAGSAPPPIQLGRAAGARVTATVRNPEHRDAVAELGAEVIAPEGFEEHGPFDVILELVGAPNLPGNLQALALWGRIMVIGIGAGAKAELNLGARHAEASPDLQLHAARPPLEEKAMTARAVERSVLPLLASGAVRVPIAATYPLAGGAGRV